MTNKALHTAMVRAMALFIPPPRSKNETAVVHGVSANKDKKTRKEPLTGTTGSDFIRVARVSKVRGIEKSTRYRRNASRDPLARRGYDKRPKNGLASPELSAQSTVRFR